MRIAMSPCALCGAASRYRAETEHARFNACEAHHPWLLDHARLLFVRFRLHTFAGTSTLYVYNYDTDSWKVGKGS